jgi:serine/threonine-protein kinase HipA
MLIFKRALFAWLIADGDMHLKNLALLKVAEPDSRQFNSVSMAPLYDAVTTRVFPRLERDRMALKLNAKDDRLRRADFRTTAGIIGIRAADADGALDELVSLLRPCLDEITLPPVAPAGSPVNEAAQRMLVLVRKRLDDFV